MTEKTKGWPPKRKAQYAARIKKSKIWRFSTGPRTAEGKARCAQNANKLPVEYQIARLALLAQRQFFHQIKQIMQVYNIDPIPRRDRYGRDYITPFSWNAYNTVEGDIRPFGDFIVKVEE